MSLIELWNINRRMPDHHHLCMGKVKDYLTKAGTTIFVGSVLLWLIMNFEQRAW
ncbi:MAG: hypothetical protein ACLSFZ_06270 [Frisingicoccus sp.]